MHANNPLTFAEKQTKLKISSAEPDETPVE